MFKNREHYYDSPLTYETRYITAGVGFNLFALRDTRSGLPERHRQTDEVSALLQHRECDGRFLHHHGVVRHQVETAQCGHVADFPILITKSQIARRTASRSRPSLLQPARTKPPVCRNGHKKNHGRTERTTNSAMHRRRKHGGRRCERPNSTSYRRKKHSAQRLILSRSFAIPDLFC